MGLLTSQNVLPFLKQECFWCEANQTHIELNELEEYNCVWQEKNADGYFFKNPNPSHGGECLCGSTGETCISDFGISFTVWWASTLALHLALFLLGAFFLKERRAEMIDPKTSAKKKKVSPMDKVTFLATAGSFLRTVWVVNTFTGRNHDSQMFGNIGDALLVKIPQIVWLSGVLYLVLVWKMLLVQSETMSKGNKDSIVKLEKVSFEFE